MKTISINVYTFDELSGSAKERARCWFREGALNYDWWDTTYEDAARIGLKITSFDLDRSNHAKGDLTKSPAEVCALILANHGKECGTYKLAAEYFKSKHVGGSMDAKEFTRALLEEYASTLQKEYEYLLSDESVDESIRANEYTFTETGKREG